VFGGKSFPQAKNSFEPPVLKKHPQPVRNSPHAFAHPADPPRAFGPRTGKRHLLCVSVSSDALQKRARKAKGCTRTDLLAAAFLRALIQHNQDQGQSQPKMGLWWPLNIRRDMGEGFGNGTSRIRVYGHFSPDDDLESCAQKLRSQQRDSVKAGEWGVPDTTSLEKLPLFLLRPLVRLMVNRPGVDMASAPFTHLEHWAPAGRDWPLHVGRAWVMGPLDKRHPLGLVALTHRGETLLSFTYDSGQLSKNQMGRIADNIVTDLDAPLGAS
jgi:hypothetical protein